MILRSRSLQSHWIHNFLWPISRPKYMRAWKSGDKAPPAARSTVDKGLKREWSHGYKVNLSLSTARSGSRGTAPIILNFGTGWEICRYPLNKRLGGTQKRSGRSGEAKNLLTVPGLEARTVQPIASPYTGCVTLAPLKTLAVKHI